MRRVDLSWFIHSQLKDLVVTGLCYHKGSDCRPLLMEFVCVHMRLCSFLLKPARLEVSAGQLRPSATHVWLHTSLSA